MKQTKIVKAKILNWHGKFGNCGVSVSCARLFTNYKNYDFTFYTLSPDKNNQVTEKHTLLLNDLVGKEVTIEYREVLISNYVQRNITRIFLDGKKVYDFDAVVNV
jgi:hypothetical protein